VGLRCGPKKIIKQSFLSVAFVSPCKYLTHSSLSVAGYSFLSLLRFEFSGEIALPGGSLRTMAPRTAR
jgi:hypothetical protein